MAKKFFLKKYVIVLSICLSFLALLFFFKGTIFQFALKRYVLYKIPLDGSWNFNYSYLSLEENGVVFHDLLLEETKASISCKAQKIFFKGPELEKISFMNHFCIEGLELSFKDNLPTDVSLTAQQIRSILSFMAQVEIKNGAIIIPNQKIDFSLAKSTSLEKLGELIFSQEGKGQVKIELSSWANSWLVDLEAKQSHLCFYKEFIDFFMGNFYKDLIIEKAKFDGRAFIAIGADNKVKDARVHMNLFDGKICNKGAGIVSSFNRIFLDLKYPINSEDKSFIENIKFSSSMDKGEITAYNKEGETRFSIKDLSGFMTLDAFKKADVEFSGFIQDGERLLPISLVAKPAEKNRNGLELDFSLQLDPIFGQKAHVHMICLQTGADFLLKSRLDSLEVCQMVVLQAALGLFNPVFKDYTINKGAYSCDVQMVFSSSGIKDFSIKNIFCEDFSIYSEKNDIGLEAKAVEGEFVVDLFQDKSLSLPFWEIELKEANITLGRQDSTAYYFEHVNVNASIKNGFFIDTSITGEINSTKGEITIDGSIDAPVIDLLMTAKGNDALKWFTTPINSYDHEVILSTRIEKKQNCYTGSGLFSLTTLQQEDKKNILSEVTFDVRGNSLKDLALNFSSKNFSSKFFPFLNEITKFSWSLDGNYSFDGTYKNGDVDLKLFGDNATYRQNVSYIENAKGFAHFVRDGKNSSWKANISLKGGQKKVTGEKIFFLENADILVSSEKSFLKIRDLLGYIELEELGTKVFVGANQFDILDEESYAFDFILKNSFYEILRTKGSLKHGIISLDEYSHFLDNEICLKKGELLDGFELDILSSIDLNDVFFPQVIREGYFGKTLCKLFIKDDLFTFESMIKDHLLKIEKNGSYLKFFYDDQSFRGNIIDKTLHVDKGRLDTIFGSICLNSCLIDAKGFSFDGHVESKDGCFTGTLEGAFEKEKNFSGKGIFGFSYGNEIKYKIDSINPCTFSVHKKQFIHDGSFLIRQNDQPILEFFAKSIIFHDGMNKISLHGLSGKTSKQIIFDKLGIAVLEDEVRFTAEADISPLEENFWFSAHVDQNTFMGMDKKIKVKEIFIRGNKKALVVDCKVPLYKNDIDISAHLFLDNKILFQVDGNCDEKNVLNIQGSYHNFLEILRLKGNLFGLSFDFTPIEKGENKIFNTQIELDFTKMRQILPNNVLSVIEKMQLGRGIELIGEGSFDQKLYFNGLIKGTDFDFLDFSLSSLFGKILLKDDSLTLSDLSIVDRSFISECKELVINLNEKEPFFKSKKMSIKKFRPCLLSKKGQRKKISNPFMFEKIEVNDLYGNLSDVNTIKGKGSIEFINTFDKQLNPVFSFAKEIISRIGLDPVVMIPVFGEVDFSLEGGKMNLLKMQNCFSDSGRSYFYLWHKSNSYLDFNGNIHLDIRMKQYVLFKFAELFIISLEGPLSSPKVSLK